MGKWQDEKCLKNDLQQCIRGSYHRSPDHTGKAQGADRKCAINHFPAAPSNCLMVIWFLPDAGSDGSDEDLCVWAPRTQALPPGNRCRLNRCLRHTSPALPRCHAAGGWAGSCSQRHVRRPHPSGRARLSAGGLHVPLWKSWCLGAATL